MIYYLMTASAGLELGCFNAAFICEQNPDQIVTNLFERECVIVYYNQSIQKDSRNANSHALIILGDNYLNKEFKRDLLAINHQHHHQLNENVNKAADFYALSYLKGELQGLFNLAIMIRDGLRFSSDVWYKIGLNDLSVKSNFTQLEAIYKL